jgi:hypothetical protein
VLARREENQLLVFERKALRTISGPIVENGVYRRRQNFELDRIEDKQTALRWSHDQKTRRPTTKGYFHREARYLRPKEKLQI